ncbi:P-loop NTPase fold protein [Nonomuraea sp. NPDC003214]
MAGRRFACAVAALLLVLVPSPAGALAGPQFLERGPLTIALERVTATSRWRIDVANTGAAGEIQLRITGPVAAGLAVEGSGRLRLGAGGTGSFHLIPQARRRAGTGELVLISAAGIDRRRVTVTPAPPFWERYRAWLIAGAVAVLLLVGAVILVRRRRRPAGTEPQPEAGTEAGDVTATPRPASQAPGFTHSDEPADQDGLNRAEYAVQLADLIRHAKPPQVIGVFGEWGSGKTSMLRQVRDLLKEDRECAHVWFDPWRHQYDENPVLPLLHVIVNDLGLTERANVRRTLRTVSEVLGSLVLSATVKIDVENVRKTLEAYDEENFRIRSQRVRLDDHLGSIIDAALVAHDKSRLVVFVDDLDRCHPDQIMTMLDALKLHFNRPNCVFVLGVAKAPLVAAVREKYADPAGDYLHKIVQVSFEMPRLDRAAFENYLDGLLSDAIKPAAGLLVSALPPNPRAIKRFVNVLLLQHRVATARKPAGYDVVILAAVLLVRDGDPDFYRRLMDDPTLLQRVSEDLETAAGEPPGWSEVVQKVVRALRLTPCGVPGDVATHIDLVRESPVPESSVVEPPQDRLPGQDRLSRRAIRSALTVLSDDVLQTVSLVAGAESGLLDPVVAFPGEQPRPLGLPEILDRGTRRMLLTGEPGAGKTVLAARLTRRLIEKAEGRDAPVPVFLPAEALRTEFRGFEQALTRALVERYQVAIADAYSMVTLGGSLSLVVDGLDESAEPGFLPWVTGWADETGAGLIVTGCVSAPPAGFQTLEVLGVAPGEAARLLEGVLPGSRGRRDWTDLAASPYLLSVLLAAPEWARDLPAEPGDFLAWYGDRALGRIGGFDGDQATAALRGLAQWLVARSLATFNSEDADLRSVLRRCGVRGMEVPGLLRAAVEAGLLREVGPKAYAFAHPRLRDHVAQS